jgi:hypothetical protein
MACNHFNRDAPGVVEEQLRVDPKLDVTPERYSTMTAMYFLPSSIVPLLLGLLSAVPKSQGGVPSVVVFVGVCIVSGARQLRRRRGSRARILPDAPRG